MEVFQDWKFWGFCIQGFITILGFSIIKFNDFSHLEKDVREIKNDVEIITKKVIKIDKNQAVQAQQIKTLENSKK